MKSAISPRSLATVGLVAVGVSVLVTLIAVWRPSEPRLAVRLVKAARQPGSEFVVW